MWNLLWVTSASNHVSCISCVALLYLVLFICEYRKVVQVSGFVVRRVVVGRENVTMVVETAVQGRNQSSSDIAREVVEELTNGGLALVLVALLVAVLWVIYITYYNSRLLGYLLTRVVNKFYFQDENFKIGKSLLTHYLIIISANVHTALCVL